MIRVITTGFVLCLAAQPLAAQHWSVEAQAGQIRSALDPVNTELQSLVVGVRYDEMNSGLRFAAGIPTTSEQAWWGSVAGAHRLALRSAALVAGIDVAANAFALSDRVQRTRVIDDVFGGRRVVPAPAQSGYAGALQALPVIGVETPKFQVHVRGGMSAYAAEFAEQRHTRNVALADAQATFLPTPSLAFMPAVRHYFAAEGDYTYGGVTAVFASGPMSVWGSSGRWLSGDDSELAWSAGASLRIRDRLTLSATGRRDLFDPLYATPGQTAWSVGISLKLGKLMPARVPIPAVFDGGRATIRLPASQSADMPRVAGDFNAWKPQPMQRQGSAWVFTVALEPGVYNYAFVNASGDWFVPADHPGRKQDGMGGEVAVLVVQ